MDAGIAAKKTNRGALLNYVDKNKMTIKSAEMKLKSKQKNTSNLTNKYVTQQTNQYINVKKMSV